MALALRIPRRQSEDDVLVYTYTFAPGTPDAWADRIANSQDRLAALGREAAAEACRDTDGRAASDLRLGTLMAGHDIVLVPVRWDLPDLCGCLEGDLHLGRVDPQTTQISLRASYPDGRDGHHALAEYAAKLLVDRLPAALGHALTAGVDEHPAPILPHIGISTAAASVPE